MSDSSPNRRLPNSRRAGLGGGAILLFVASYLVVWSMSAPSPSDQSPAPPGERNPAAAAFDGGSEPDRTAASAGRDDLPAAERSANTARLGELKDVGNGVKLSTAGLRYTPGSQEGHRLTHVLRHDKDQPTRPGLHGVFDGDADDLLAVLDEAYLLVKQRSRRVSSRREGSRMVHEVDLQRRIGFIGGQEGRRRKNPPTTRVRMVLEDDRVITAFPF